MELEQPRWHEIWKMVFPNDPLPDTCFFDSSISPGNSVERLCSILETEGTILFRKLGVEHRPIVGPLQSEPGKPEEIEEIGSQMIDTYFPDVFRQLGQRVRDLAGADDAQQTESSGTGSAD